jgi:hypothetical protein
MTFQRIADVTQPIVDQAQAVALQRAATPPQP